MELIPAIDLRGGRCVRLLKGRFDAETTYPADPLALAREYQDLGAERLHIVDLDGARDGSPGNWDLISRLAELPGLALQVGGGVRSEDRLKALFALGAARVVIGSLAVLDPVELRCWLDRYGPDRVVLALDVRHDANGEPLLVTHGWQQPGTRSLWELLADPVMGYGDSALEHVLCTDVERDGALAGPNLALYQTAVCRFPGIAWQASGGVRDADDLRALAGTGVGAAVSGRALLERRLTTSELQPFLPSA